MNIVIGGDIVPTKSNESFFFNGDVDKLTDSTIQKLLEHADLVVANLETPLTDKIKPIMKNGPCLITDPKAVTGIKKLNIGLLGLANNHIMDQGSEGVYQTIAALESNGIKYIGVGEDLSTAKEKSFFVICDAEGFRIGIFACTEHEFSVATKKSVGANPFDPLETFDTIKKLKNECDYLIVLYHGGKEYYRFPTPYLKRIFHKISDCGANLVISQHSHCIGCYESYNNSTLVYGQGNFIFDNQDNEFWNSGMLINLHITHNEKNVEFVFFEKNNGRIEIAKENTIKDAFLERSTYVNNDEFLSDRYREFAKEKTSVYLNALHGNNIFSKICTRVFGERFVEGLYSSESLLALLNFVQCEAHIELLEEILTSRLKEMGIHLYYEED